MEAYLRKLSQYGNRVAIIVEGRSHTYFDLYNKIQHYVAEIQSFGIRPGQVVVLYSDYSFESIALLFALSAKKNIVAPVTRIPDSELMQRITESNSQWCISLQKSSLEVTMVEVKYRHPLIAELNQKSRSGLILFSSGMTGKPKAMIHDFDNLISAYIDRRGKEFVFLVFLLFDHIGGINTLLNALSMGSALVIPKTRDVDYICRLIEATRVNILPSSPTFLNLLLLNLKQKSYGLTSLKMITYGTEPMPEALLARVRDQFPNVKLLQTFGTSETGIARTSSQSSASTLIKIDEGDTEYKVVLGELWLKSKTQIIGYLNASMENFTDDGWFRTGDLAQESGDGYIKILGRIKEIINVGGEKVLPSEVESVVLELAEIDDCVAFAIPNMITGQAVGINITSSISDEKYLRKLVKDHCARKLDSFKNPVKISVIDKVDFNSRFKKLRAQ
jgi:acyl-CoA synthetase (AMP-forming)/AMP-acid ligase II